MQFVKKIKIKNNAWVKKTIQKKVYLQISATTKKGGPSPYPSHARNCSIHAKTYAICSSRKMQCIWLDEAVRYNNSMPDYLHE